MSAPRVRLRSGVGPLLLVAGVLLGVLLWAGMAVVGPAVALLPMALVICWWLFWHPLPTLGLLFATTVLIEGQSEVWPVTLDRWYGTIGPTPLHPPDLLVLLLLGWVVHERVRTTRPGPGLGPFAPPMALLAVALAFGLVTGYLGASDRIDLIGSARVLALLLVVPLVTAEVLGRTARTRAAVGFAVALVAGRAAIALAGVLTGRAPGAPGSSGVTAAVSAEASTFYEPTTNFLMVVTVLGITVALVRRLSLPRWLLLVAPMLLVTIALSYRRSFWIATILGLVLVLLVATGRRGRPWLVLGGAAVVLALYVAISAGGSTDATNPVLYRAESLNPSKLTTTTGDRYRLDEQRNVLAELRAHPLTGLGLGVPWTVRFALSEYHEGGQLYTHVTPLWFWLKLGPLGLVAYVWLWAIAIRTAYRVWRRGSDGRVRAGALALAAGFCGLIVAELTGPFTGIDVRITLVVGMCFGWLVAAAAAIRPPTGAEDDDARRYAVAAR
ncbi:MAG: O-antigen ligase family protein [Acidimicrobiales bacterium]|nr:O-antigen ligase family protein [Acidimicrobiales bacterium]